MNNRILMGALCVGLSLAAGCTTTGATRAPLEYFPASEAGAAYSAAVRVGDVIYLPGQVGIRADGSIPESVQEQTRVALENMSTQLQSMGSSMDNVFNCSAMLDDISTWSEFNAVYASFFKPGRLPTRATFGVEGLAAKELKVELVCQAYGPR